MSASALGAAPGLSREVALLERLAGGFARSHLQCNQRHESDAELIRLPGSRSVLALTTDAISEEIESGLYADPYLIGWMTVMVNASDLAAVGAPSASCSTKPCRRGCRNLTWTRCSAACATPAPRVASRFSALILT